MPTEETIFNPVYVIWNYTEEVDGETETHRVKTMGFLESESASHYTLTLHDTEASIGHSFKIPIDDVVEIWDVN